MDPKTDLANNIQNNINKIRKGLGNPPDLIIRSLAVGGLDAAEAVVVYIQELIDNVILGAQVIVPLTNGFNKLKKTNFSLKQIKAVLVSAPNVTEVYDAETAIKGILTGKTVLLVDGLTGALTMDTAKQKWRDINDPESAMVTQGPREGFVESIATNMALIRKKVASPDVRFEIKKLGRRTQTDVAVCYIEGIVRKELLNEVQKRLKKIDIDAILEIGYIAELIRDGKYIPFPDSNITERPDLAVQKLLEGYVVIMVDGTPFVMIVPARLAELLHSADDYYLSHYQATSSRIIRWVALFISLLLPSFYVAVISFNHEIIPDELMYHIIRDREVIAFPALLEAFFMESAFEILREAGLRMPKSIGQTISIVGVLVVGEAAVRAGIVSPTMIVVVGLTALSSFAIPNVSLANSIRLLRFPVMFLSGMLGFYGLMFGLIVVLNLLLSLKSYGIPYLSPFVSITPKDFKTVIWRKPWWSFIFKPIPVAADKKRQGGKSDA